MWTREIGGLDMTNVTTIATSGRVNFQDLGKYFALDIRCFVVNKFVSRFYVFFCEL